MIETVAGNPEVQSKLTSVFWILNMKAYEEVLMGLFVLQ